MSLILICQIIFSVSLSGILFIFLRNLPLLIDFEPQPVPEEKKLIFRCKKGFLRFKNKFSGKFQTAREKTVHKIRILVLKIDNFLTSYLKKAQEQRRHQKKISLFRKKAKSKK